MLPWVCTVMKNIQHQNVARTSVTHSAAPLVLLFCSYLPQFDVFSLYSLNEIYDSQKGVNDTEIKK